MASKQDGTGGGAVGSREHGSFPHLTLELVNHGNTYKMVWGRRAKGYLPQEDESCSS